MGHKSKILSALDLFAGAGGFSQGMINAGFNVVAAIESDQQIAETYKYNHPNAELIVDDIRNVSSSYNDALCSNKVINIKEIFNQKNLTCDIIFGGPPCQGFSMSGYRIRKNKSFLKDERNSLFMEFTRMVKYLFPKVFILENVPGIMDYNSGSIKQEIFDSFKKLGYNVEAKILCAADYGIPQLRYRAFFIGNRLSIDPKLFFPAPKYNPDNYITVKDAISDLPPLRAGSGTEKTVYANSEKLSEYQLKLRSKTNVTYNHISSNHKPETIVIMSMIKEGQGIKDLPHEYHTKSVHSGAYGRMEYNMPSYTLTTRLNTPSVGRITHPTQNRTITPREAARIQSFSDNYRFFGNITSLGMQIGNAVPPLLAESIGTHILSIINAK